MSLIINYFGNRPSSVVAVSYLFSLKDLLQNSTNLPNSNWGIYSQDGYSSIINPDGTVGTKALAPGHIIINVNDEVNNPDTGLLRPTQLLACLSDYKYPNSGNTCYPLNGYPGSATLDDNNPSRQFLIDTTNSTYISLVATYQGDDSSQLQLCFISNAVLQGLQNGTTIHLQWTDSTGNTPCGFSINKNSNKVLLR